MDRSTNEIIVTVAIVVILLLTDYLGNNFPWGTVSAVLILLFELNHNHYRSVESEQIMKSLLEEVISEQLRQNMLVSSTSSVESATSPSDTLMTNSILFVEGSIDKMIIEHWSKQLGLSLFPPEVAIIPMGHVRSNQVKLWKMLTQSLNVKIGWVFDGDRIAERAIKLLKDSKFPEEYIWTLELGEIESYYPKNILREFFNKLLNIDEMVEIERETITQELEKALDSKETTIELSKLARLSKGKTPPHYWKQLAAREVLKSTDVPSSITPLLKEIEEKLHTSKNDEDKLGW